MLWYDLINHLFDSTHKRTDMIKTDPQAIDYPCPTTNTPSLTTRHILIVCGALRRVCPCDDYRDAKEDDCDPDAFVTRQTNLAENRYEKRR